MSEYTTTLQEFDHLWQNDMHSAYTDFKNSEPSPEKWQDQVTHLVDLEDKASDHYHNHSTLHVPVYMNMYVGV